ncbi:MAG: DUF3179 domain-containing protein [Synechococcus sp.]
MARTFRILAGSFSLIVLLLASLILHAGGWANFKLSYFSWTQVLHKQDLEFSDLRDRQVIPEETTRIDLEQLLNGGPPKDGIPSIDNPLFDTADSTPFNSDEWVVGIVVNGEAKAYPYGILNWHEIVNDTVGGINLAVSYCPLCDTILAFERNNTTFGVSGKLYQSCLVMYDRADDSLYAQPWGLGVVGPEMNRFLDRFPVVKTRLGDWLERHPDSSILATDTGYNRDYHRYPYGTYNQDERIIFPVRGQQRLSEAPKEIVTYIWEPDRNTPHNQFSGDSEQFVHRDLQREGQQEVEFNGGTAIARWDEQLNTVIVEDSEGYPIPSSTAYAFVYPAFFD